MPKRVYMFVCVCVYVIVCARVCVGVEKTIHTIFVSGVDTTQISKSFLCNLTFKFLLVKICYHFIIIMEVWKVLVISKAL